MHLKKEQLVVITSPLDDLTEKRWDKSGNSLARHDNLKNGIEKY
ncbi:MAG: hypothetical protein WKG06_04875 [Segetibacter sp.]